MTSDTPHPSGYVCVCVRSFHLQSPLLSSDVRPDLPPISAQLVQSRQFEPELLSLLLHVYSEERELNESHVCMNSRFCMQMTKAKEERTKPGVGDQRNRSDRGVIKELLLSNHLRGSEHPVLRPVTAWRESAAIPLQKWFRCLLGPMLVPRRFIH